MSTKDLSIEERPKFYERTRDKIVCIRKNGVILGGGVYIKVGGHQRVLTAAHVVYAEKNLSITCYDARSFAVEIVHMNRKRDVALLRVKDGPKEGFKCLKFSDKEVIRGSEIHLIGHPGRQQFSYNIGRVSSASGMTCEDLCLGCLQLRKVSSFPKVPDPDLIDDFRGIGASVVFVARKNVHGGGRVGGTGAPFLDSSGRIVGLYSFALNDEDYAISLSDVQQVMEDFKQKNGM